MVCVCTMPFSLSTKSGGSLGRTRKVPFGFVESRERDCCLLQQLQTQHTLVSDIIISTNTHHTHRYISTDTEAQQSTQYICNVLVCLLCYTYV